MLAGANGTDGPFIMQAVWKGNEDAVDVGVVENIFVRVFDFGDAMRFSKRLGLVMIASRYRLDDDFGMRLGGSN